MDVSATCPHCHRLLWTEVKEPVDFHCTSCAEPLFPFATEDFLLHRSMSQCPICGCQHVYRQKDFNRKLGVGLLIAGVLLSLVTYGISLLVVTLLDWFLFKKVGDVAICYLCDAQFRNEEQIKSLDSFNLVLHDHYRALKANQTNVEN